MRDVVRLGSKSGQSDTVSDNSSRPYESGASCQAPSRTLRHVSSRPGISMGVSGRAGAA